MTKKPKATTPLAQLRRALRKTQNQFAELVGESVSFISQIEQGKKKVSHTMANTLMLLFGCDPRSFDKKRIKHLLPFDQPLRERIEEWEKIFPIDSVDVAVMANEVFIPKLEVLVSAASNEQLGLALLCRLDDWVTKTAKGLGLEESIKKELASRSADGDGVDWDPLIQIHKDDDNLVTFTVSVSQATSELLSTDSEDAKRTGRGLPQVNPHKIKRIVQLATMAARSSAENASGEESSARLTIMAGVGPRRKRT